MRIKRALLLLIILATASMSFARQQLDSAALYELMDKAEYYFDRDLDSGYYYAKQVLDGALALNNPAYLGDAYNTYGNYFFMKTIIDSANFYFEKAKTHFEEQGDMRGVFDVINGIGTMLFNSGDYQGATTYLLDGLQRLQSEHPELDTREAALLINLGQVYQNLKDYERSNLYNGQALELLTALDNKQGIASAQANLAWNQVELGKLDSAMMMAESARAIFLEEDIAFGTAAMDYLLGKIYRILGNYTVAEDYLIKAKEVHLDFGDPLFITVDDIEIGKLYIEIGAYAKAKTYLQSALEYSILYNYKPERQDTYEQLAIYYEAVGDFPQALEYEKLRKQLSDSLFNDRISAQLAEMETKYQAERRQQQLDLQNEQLARQEAEISQQSVFRNALIAGLVLLLIIGALVYRNERAKTKSLREKEALLKEIHHRVKNNLQVISSLLNMQSRGTDNEEMQEVIKEGQSRVKAMSLIHQKLYQTDDLSEIDFQDYIQQLIAQLETLYKAESVEIQNTVNANGLRLDIDTAIPLGLILNELVSNAYKYAFEGMEEGTINVDLMRIDNERLQLEVTDNGKGLPGDFNFDTAKSLGLKLVNILTKQLQGTLDYNTADGTSFSITFSEIKAT